MPLDPRIATNSKVPKRRREVAPASQCVISMPESGAGSHIVISMCESSAQRTCSWGGALKIAHKYKVSTQSTCLEVWLKNGKLQVKQVCHRARHQIAPLLSMAAISGRCQSLALGCAVFLREPGTTKEPDVHEAFSCKSSGGPQKIQPNRLSCAGLRRGLARVESLLRELAQATFSENSGNVAQDIFAQRA